MAKVMNQDEPVPASKGGIPYWVKITIVFFLGWVALYATRAILNPVMDNIQAEFSLSAAQLGLISSIFFIGYAFFEIPGNVLMDKIGARKTLARIMILWGLASAATMFVSSASQLYFLRLLLGIFEAGFFPGVILYLSFWFPSYMRGRVTSILILATLTAPIIGGPVSGLIMTHMNGYQGLGGWQWMFLLEALPIIFIGLLCLYYLTDKPETSRWLNNEERLIHKQIMQDDRDPSWSENDDKYKHSGAAVWACLKDVRIYLLASLAFAAYCGSYGFNFWLPTMIKEMGVTDIAQISFYAVIPFSLAAVGMITVGRSSDKRRERRWHYIISMLFGAAMMCLAAFWTGDMISRLIILGLAGFGFSGGVVVAWSLPAAYLEGKTSPAGIAMVSTLATMSGLFAPWIIGLMREMTGTNEAALLSIAGIMVLAALIMAFLIPAKAVYVSDK